MTNKFEQFFFKEDLNRDSENNKQIYAIFETDLDGRKVSPFPIELVEVEEDGDWHSTYRDNFGSSPAFISATLVDEREIEHLSKVAERGKLDMDRIQKGIQLIQTLRN